MEQGRVSAAVAADMLGVSGPTFAKLIAEGAFPRSPPKAGYVLREVVRGTVAHYMRRAAGRAGEDGGMLLSKQRARLATAKAEAEERKNLAAAGRLVSLEAVSKVWDRGIRNCRERLLSVAGQCCDRLTLHTLEDRVQVFEILNQQICEALTNLADGRFEGDGVVTDHVEEVAG